MSILANAKTRIICCGIMTPEGMRHTEQAIAYGSNIVGGVAEGKGGTVLFDVPVFDTLKEAVKKAKPDAVVIYSGPDQAVWESMEAIRLNVPLVVCTTERTLVHDILKIKEKLKRSKSRFIGPASPGIITAEICKAGSMPAHLFKKGNIGVISRSGSLMYEALQQMYEKGLGVSTCVALGAYPILGTSFKDIYRLFQKDNETKAILIIGEIGGLSEQQMAYYYSKLKTRKPLIAYVAGAFVPEETYMGNIGAIVKKEEETASFKKNSLRKAGAHIVDSPSEIGVTVFDVVKDKSEAK